MSRAIGMSRRRAGPGPLRPWLSFMSSSDGRVRLTGCVLRTGVRSEHDDGPKLWSRHGWTVEGSGAPCGRGRTAPLELLAELGEEDHRIGDGHPSTARELRLVDVRWQDLLR